MSTTVISCKQRKKQGFTYAYHYSLWTRLYYYIHGPLHLNPENTKVTISVIRSQYDTITCKSILPFDYELGYPYIYMA